MSLICISVDSLQVAIAASVDGRLVRLSLERDSRQLGNIYRGRVVNVLPGMDAAFVDIGTGRNALLYFADLREAKTEIAGRRIQEVLHPGDERSVQITRPAVGSKGARVSEQLSLAGRYLVMIAGSENIGVSKRIESKQERDRLRRIVEKLRPLDYGVIVRTEAEDASEAQLAADIISLKQRFGEIEAAARQHKAPCNLHREMGAMERLVRDQLNENISAIFVDDAEECRALQKLAQRLTPHYAARVQFYDGVEPIFQRYGLEKEIALAGERVVPLPSGGHLTFDEAEALTAIDVNTGRFVGKNRFADTVLATNLEAVDETARQLQLRNIGGIVVIDFIDMDNTRDRIKIMNALEMALKRDRTRTRIVQLSPLGLVEMTRRREGETLRQILHDPCPYCDGDGIIKSALTVSIETRHAIRELLGKTKADRAVADLSVCLVTVHPDVALTLINESLESLRALEKEFGTTLFLRADLSSHREEVKTQLLYKKAAQSLLQQHQSTFHVGAHLHFSPQLVLKQSQNGDMVFIMNNFIVFNEDDVRGNDVVLEMTEVTTLFARARVLAHAT